MSEPSLLSYPSLQSILEYFEVNHRILLAQNIPSIKYAEKVVPLKIRGSIILKSDSTTINSLQYSLEVIRCDPEMKKIERFGYGYDNRVTWNLDTEGNPIPGPPLAPGDFDFGGKEKMKQFWGLERYVMEDGKMVWKKKEYQYFLKFSVHEFGEKGTYEYMEYHQNFHIAVKYLNSKLFAGRPPISIGTLYIEPEKYLRLPVDLKFEKCGLEVENIHTGLETLRPLLTPSSFPINYVGTDRITVADHEFLKGVETLYIDNRDQKEFPPLPYKQIRFDRGITDEELLNILIDWKTGKRGIGTLCTFGLDIRRHWTRKMDFLMEQVGAELGKVPKIRNTWLPHCVIFNINDTSEINIYCIEKNYSYTMEMRIESKGFATRI